MMLDLQKYKIYFENLDNKLLKINKKGRPQQRTSLS